MQTDGISSDGDCTGRYQYNVFSGIFNKDPLRPKKLLLHQSEINKLAGQIAQKGYTIVPLQVYLSKGRVKMEIGLGRGKKLYDKRDSIAKKDQKREAEKEFKVRNLY